MMRATLVLCDFAEVDVASGKVHMIGAGWTATGPMPGPHSVVAFIPVPPERVKDPLAITLRLLDKTGQVVSVPSLGSPQPVEIRGQVELAPTADWNGTTPLSGIFSINLMMLLLPAGQSYRWSLEIDSKEAATTEFYVRANPDPQAEQS